MSDPHEKDVNHAELEKLRKLLLGDECQDLLSRLACPESYSESVAGILSEAIKTRSKMDGSLTTALMPTVEEAIQQSVRKDPGPLVDAIFPIIGPSIRKSISEAFNDMLKNINYVVEQSLSMRSLKWRIEAKRTGKTYAEIALLRTLDYRVEQVYLIHKETGLLLEHMVSKNAVTNDPDMVSAMLTAIRDFVTDSFSIDQNESLNSLRVGELTVFVEQGPKAILAAVVAGNPPADLGSLLKETIEKIHADFAIEMNNFEGDSASFEPARDLIGNCLISRQRENKSVKKSGAILWGAGICLIGLLLYWGVDIYQQHRDWRQVVTTFGKEPGYILISAEQKEGEHYMYGLRDPQARMPDEVVNTNSHNNLNLQWNWQPFLSLQDEFIYRRINNAITVPEGVKINYAGGELVFEGEATQSWIDSNVPLAARIAGVTSINTGQLTSTDVYLKEFNHHREILESINIYFNKGETMIPDGQAGKLAEAGKAIDEMMRYAIKIPLKFEVEILGYSDSSGSSALNGRISHERALAVLFGLPGDFHNLDYIRTKGLGSLRTDEISQVHNTNATRQRRVRFEVHLGNQ